MPFKPPVGISVYKKSKSLKGFTLVVPLRQNKAFLIDMEGNEVHLWKLNEPGYHGMLLPSGNLFITQQQKGGAPLIAGKAGIIREYDWKEKVIWEHRDENQHHDARRLKNGNTIYIAWEILSKKDQKRVRGGVPNSEAPDGQIYGDVIREIDPNGTIVWEWRISEMEIEKYPIMPLFHRAEFAHANTVAPLPNGDIMVSFRVINTIIIIDKKTRKIKWQMRDDYFGGQHDCQMLPNKNVLLFANGHLSPLEHPHSKILEINPRNKKRVWEYVAERGMDFFSPHISGVQRLTNGNTLICEGGFGRLFEVTKEGEIVWEYSNPYHQPHPILGKINWVFRAYRYSASSDEIRRRLRQK